MMTVQINAEDLDLLEDAITLRKLEVRQVQRWEFPLSPTTTVKLEIVGPISEVLAPEFFKAAMDIIVRAQALVSTSQMELPRTESQQ